MGQKSTKNKKKTEARPVRYAVVGLGHIAQVAVLPAFQHAKNSELAALISGDEKKLKKLSRKYGVRATGSYDGFERCLNESNIDAVYIATPNTEHKDLAIRAARMGIHVLCEKPLATTVKDAQEMIDVAKRFDVKLMTAYRLHFEAANLEAIEVARSGRLGDLKIFSSVFSMQVQDGNIRLRGDLGGGPLYDLGIYAINASRYMFRQEPESVVAVASNTGDRRFDEVEECWSAILRFPSGQLATFTTSFGAADCGYYEVVGTKGSLRVEPAYEYAHALKHTLKIDDKTSTKTFQKRDQFAAELIYFSECVTNDRTVEPSGEEGLADLKIIERIQAAAKTGSEMKIDPVERFIRPTRKQSIRRPPVRPPQLVNAAPPHVD